MIIQQTNSDNQNIIRSGVHEGAYTYGEHIHQYSELVWILDGEIEMTVDGRCETARAGDMTVITPFQVHSFHTSKYSKIHIAVISDSFINPFVSFDELCAERESAIFKMSDELVSILHKKEYVNACLNRRGIINDNNYLHNLRSLIYLILTEYFNTVPTIPSSVKRSALSKILVYLSSHYTEDLNLESVGAALGYSPKYVSNCISSLGSFNFRTIINSLRVEAAKSLLVGEPRLTVTDIALRCGFSNERSFHRAFFDIVGITPKQYKQQKTANN